MGLQRAGCQDVVGVWGETDDCETSPFSFLYMKIPMHAVSTSLRETFQFI